MTHTSHDTNKSYATPSMWALFAVSIGENRPALISSRGFCKTT